MNVHNDHGWLATVHNGWWWRYSGQKLLKSRIYGKGKSGSQPFVTIVNDMYIYKYHTRKETQKIMILFAILRRLSVEDFQVLDCMDLSTGKSQPLAGSLRAIVTCHHSVIAIGCAARRLVQPPKFIRRRDVFIHQSKLTVDQVIHKLLQITSC